MKTRITDEMLAKYFSGNCSDQEKQEVEHWKEISEDNSRIFEEMKALWRNAFITNTYNPDTDASLHKVNSKLGFFNEEKASDSKVIGFHVLRFTLRAAAALLIFCAGYWFFHQYTETTKHQVLCSVSALDEKKIVILPDSTHVWLNKSSSLSYPENFEAKERKVTLEGEAYFEVAKIRGNPFIIEAGNSVTTVLGTHFSVRARKNEGEVIVTVTEGKVQLANKVPAATSAVKLLAGDRGIFKSITGAVEKEKNTDPNFMAWQNGKLVFNDTPIDDVIKTLSDYYGIKIQSKLSANNQITFTTTFENQSLEEIFKIMELTLNVQVEKTNNNYIILPENKK